MRYTVTSSDSAVGPVVVVVEDVSLRRPSGMLAVRIAFGPESTGDEHAVTASTRAIKIIVRLKGRTCPITPAPEAGSRPRTGRPSRRDCPPPRPVRREAGRVR